MWGINEEINCQEKESPDKSPPAEIEGEEQSEKVGRTEPRLSGYHD